MRAKGFFGLLKMDTLVILPADRDRPLCSYDCIYAAVNDTLIVELYDALIEGLTCWRFWNRVKIYKCRKYLYATKANREVAARREAVSRLLFLIY